MASIYHERRRIGYGFREFLDLIQNADLTLKIEKDLISNENYEIVRFNYFETLEKYSNALSSAFRSACEELENTLLEKYEKIKKLDYLTRYIIEIEVSEKSLVKDAVGLFNHLDFKFVNVSEQPELQNKTLSNADAQKYLRFTELYLFKCKIYLTGLRDNIKITNQEGFQIPASMIADPNDATEKNPLAYFDYFICKNGLLLLKNDFIPTDDESDGYEYVGYNVETEVKTYADMDNEGEWIERKIKFSEVILNKMLIEFANCKNMIDQHVNNLVSDEEARFFFKLILDKLQYLLGMINKAENLKKYTDVPKPIKGLIRYCYEKYKSFCPEPEDNSIITNLLKDSKLYQLKETPLLLQISSSKPGVFLWKNNSEAKRLNILLHGALNTIFIDATEMNIFSKAFDGGNHPDPLGIKWIDTPRSKSKVNKVTLLYLFKQLEEKGLLECQYGLPMFLRKLEYVFADPTGEKFENWKQSLKSVEESKSMTPEKKQIDEIVTMLASKRHSSLA